MTEKETEVGLAEGVTRQLVAHRAMLHVGLRYANPTYAELGDALGNVGSRLTEETPLTYRSKKPFKIP